MLKEKHAHLSPAYLAFFEKRIDDWVMENKDLTVMLGTLDELEMLEGLKKLAETVQQELSAGPMDLKQLDKATEARDKAIEAYDRQKAASSTEIVKPAKVVKYVQPVKHAKPVKNTKPIKDGYVQLFPAGVFAYAAWKGRS